MSECARNESRYHQLLKRTKQFSIARLTVVFVHKFFFGNSCAQSVYTLRPEDAHAVYLTDAKADGVSNDADALQRAIDHVQETTHQGVWYLFLKGDIGWGGQSTCGLAFD